MSKEFMLKALCIAISAIPWAVLVVLTVLFGLDAVLFGIWTAVKAIFALCVIVIVVLFVRACGLELYERAFERNGEQ